MSETSQQSSENEKSHRPRGSRRRQVHNEVERRRKDKINGWISKIAELLPTKDVHKQSKISILEQTVDYIKYLVTEREKLLSENYSEVQAGEVKSLKKDLKIVKEQNALYEKLLQQANISLNSLPKKVLKYSNKFVRKNGVLSVKNSEDTYITTEDVVEVDNNISVNIPDCVSKNDVTSCSEIPKPVTTVSKAVKSSTKSNVQKNTKTILPSITQSNVPPDKNQCSTAPNTAVIAQTIYQGTPLSQDSIIPIVNWQDASKNSTSLHAGGVTTVLSQFPVMSTMHGSSFNNSCNKTIPTIIIPSGGNILQNFSVPEKTSNAISIICPTTLPVLLPQVINVSSISRNVGLPSTLICAGPINNQCSDVSKSALGNTLVTLNPSSTVVPISSGIAANSGICLPPQPTVVGNVINNESALKNTPLTHPAAQVSKQHVVPFMQNYPPTSKSNMPVFSSSNACSQSNISTSSSIETTEVDYQRSKSHEANMKRNSVSNNNAREPAGSAVETLSCASGGETNEKHNNTQNPHKKSKHVNSISFSTPPSLQVLSANKIISLASQSQKVRTNLVMPSHGKSSESASLTLQSNENKSKENSNNFCLLTNPLTSESVDTEENNPPETVTKSSEQVTSENSSSSDANPPKSVFSLTVLINTDQSVRDSTDSNAVQNIEDSVVTFPVSNNSVSDQQISDSVSDNLSSVSTSRHITSYSDLPASESTSDFSKQNDVYDNSNSISPSCSKESEKGNSLPTPDSKSDDQRPLEKDKCESLNVSNIIVSFQSNNGMSSMSNDVNETISVSSVNHCTQCSALNCKHVSKAVNDAKSNSEQSIQSVKNTNQSSQIHSSATVSTYSVAGEPVGDFHETVPFVMNEATINQNMLPSLFPNNQIVSITPSVFMCAANENQPCPDENSSILMSHSIQLDNSTAPSNINHCPVPESVSNYTNITVMNKDSNTFAEVSVRGAISEEKEKSMMNMQGNSSASITSKLSQNLNVESAHSEKDINDANLQHVKQVPATKKKHKAIIKGVKTSANSKSICEANSLPSTSVAFNKPPDVESFSKSDSSSCIRQDSSFIFTSDILAQATESIFGSDILDNNHLTKKNVSCFTDVSPDINAPSSTSEKDISNYKTHYASVASEQMQGDAFNGCPTREKNASLSNLQAADVLHSSEMESSDQINEELNQKAAKIIRVRKSKSSPENEPPSKKAKENTNASSKVTNNPIFNQPLQTDLDLEKRTTTSLHLNIPCSGKQMCLDSSASPPDQPVDVSNQFGNQIHIPENNCKTPSSVDAMFSLTPMLGDILKDVSHGTNLELRNSFHSCNEGQTLFPSDKNTISFNYSTSSSEDYLNLHRMYFPILPEISATPSVQVTNVSFAHTTSLCSTHNDTLKTTETLSLIDSQSKADSKKKTLQNVLHENNMISSETTKPADCVLKDPDSFNISSTKNNTLHFSVQNSCISTTNSISGHTVNSVSSQTASPYCVRDNFNPSVSQSINFYPSVSSSSNISNLASSSAAALSHSSYACNNSTATLPFSVQISNTGSNNTVTSQSSLSKTDSLSHSLCSLLKETTNILSDNRTPVNGPSSQIISSSSSNTSQSKYSALSLISDQTSYPESISTSTCHPSYVQSPLVCSSSDVQFTAASSCSRNQRSSLSYSAESLLQTSCANSEKNKSKSNVNARYTQRVVEKKNDRNSLMHIHSDTNIFMPVSNCDISIQNAPLVPLPSVTSFHNFPSTYTLCETVPSTTIFNSVTRPNIPLSLANDNFLNHINLNMDSQLLSNRHDSSAVPKPDTNITLPFENHSSLYNNCNFLPHMKPPAETSRPSESGACFQPTSFNSSYSHQTQKPNCCHFSHRTIAANSEIAPDVSLPMNSSVPSFHAEKGTFQGNKTSLQNTFSQNNSNFVGNFFYNAPANVREGNEMPAKPSNIRASQEMFVPEGVRQNHLDHNAGSLFNSRKPATSSRTKGKKAKNVNSNENLNLMPNNSMTNFTSTQDPCNKSNISCIPNGYFKNNSHPVLPPPSQLHCNQTKLNENTPTVIPSNPPFNTVLHQQGDNFLNLNFQPPNFTVSPLPRPPTQPLSCSCLTAPIISHTFSTSAHPVPNFNLSNILPDMGCSGSQVSLSPVKFPPINHSLSSSSQCQTSSTAHIVSHQSCTPALYPPHPPMVRSSLNPILGHNSQPLNDSQVSLVGAGNATVMPQNATFSSSQNPTFRNVIHSLTFSHNDR